MIDKNKGFTLSECVVSVLVAVLLAIMIASISLLSVSNSNKAIALQLGLNVFEDVSHLILGVELEDDVDYKSNELEKCLLDYFGVALDLSESELNKGVLMNLKFSEKRQQSVEGKILVELNFFKQNKNLCYSGKIYYNSKMLYEKDLVMQKRVLVWCE